MESLREKERSESKHQPPPSLATLPNTHALPAENSNQRTFIAQKQDISRQKIQEVYKIVTEQ